MHPGDLIPNQYRADVHDGTGISTASGFAFAIDAYHQQLLERPGCRTIEVYAVSHGSGPSNKGATNKLIGSTVYCGERDGA
jgi:hypothetical protein